MGTQSINDFHANEGARAVFENSAWVCLLRQKPETIDALKKEQRLSLDDYKERVLRSLQTDSGKFAEVMITGPFGYSVSRLRLDKFSNVLYSTLPEEHAAVQDKQAQGLSLKDAIQKVAEERYHD